MKMKKIIMILTVLLSVSLILPFITTVKAEEEMKSPSVTMDRRDEVPVDADDAAVTGSETPAAADPVGTDTGRIIKDLIEYYGNYGEQADGKVQELLSELNVRDPEKGRLWLDILDYWAYTNEDLTVNLEQLPDGLPDTDELCLVILGFELNYDGTMQEELIGRLNVALNCAAQYPNAYVLCTGGGTAKGNNTVTEAGLMGQWLLAHGLSPDRLIIEDRSRTTAQNALFSYTILLAKYPQVHSVALISSQYHIPWGALLFESVFMKTASEQQTPDIHVISNCAFPCFNEKYKDIPRFETGGMLQMIGEDDLAMNYYRGIYTKPEL